MVLTTETVAAASANANGRERRVACIRVVPDIILAMLRPGAFKGVTVAGLPPDAEYHHVWYDFQMDCFFVVVASPSLAPVREGDAIPTLCVTFSYDEPTGGGAG
jgi:hypothetical protein